MTADTLTSTALSPTDALAHLAQVIESRKPANGGDPQASYVARLLHKGPDAFLKKIGEEATEVVMAAKDVDHGASTHGLVGEVADLWFHSMVALAHYGLGPADVVAMMRANPDAFIQGNVNRVRAGSVLQIPDEATAKSVSNTEARQILAAQSRDFNTLHRKPV